MARYNDADAVEKQIVDTYQPTNEKFVETMGAIYNAAAVALASERDKPEQMRK